MGEPRERTARPVTLPPSIAPLAAGRRWRRDLVGEAGARVHRLHAPGLPDMFLKYGKGAIADDVIDEMVRARWLAAHLPSPMVRGFVLDEAGAWLMTDAVPGRTAYQWLEDMPDARPAVVAALAGHLRLMHAIPIDQCPFDSSLPVRMAQGWRRIEAEEVDVDDFGEGHAGWTAREVWQEIVSLLPIDPDPVVTHGDYSLDNILIADGVVTGCIDLARLGVADRYQDLAILATCLDEFDPTLRAHFFAAYGIERPDERKLRLHRCLDELF